MEIRKTITSIFMVPTLKIPKNALKENGFVNAYSSDVERDIQSYPGCIYLLFRPDDIPKFREFLDDEYERTKSIIEDYDYDEGFVVVVYKLNPRYSKDFDLVKKGKYSKTSSEFQAVFPKVIKLMKNGLHRDEISLQYRVFNKTEDMIDYWKDKIGIDWDDDFEVWDGYDEEKEVLRISQLKQLV